VFALKKKRKKKIQKKRTEAFGETEKLRNWGEKEGHIISASILRLRRELLFFLSLFLSLKNGISLSLLCFSLLLLRAFRRAL
jgi:hypothetical protein